MKKVCYKSEGTEETGAKIIKKLEELGGVNTEPYIYGTDSCAYYYIDEGGVIAARWYIPSGYTLATLEDELTSPFEAMVWDDDESKAVQRVVFNINENLKYPVCCYSNVKCVSNISKGRESPIHFKHFRKITTNPTEQIKSKLIELTNLINQIL